MLRPEGSMSRFFKALALLILVLICHVSAEPFQCNELKNVVPACSCEARLFKNEIINNQVVINCRNLELDSIPNIVGSSEHVIYEMTLRQNNIQTIPAAAFNGLKVQRIDLRDNRLTDINNNSFQGLEEILKELYLGAENRANVQPPIGSLTNLKILNTLHLEYFTFPQNGLDPGTLNLLTDLTTLTLKRNKLRFIEPLALPTSLTSLTLDNQDLSSFPVTVLRSLAQLQSLSITNNQITALYNQALENNILLKYLDLGYNQISSLSPDCFKGIASSLYTLSLQNNPLSTVDSLDEIKTLTALTELRLSSITLPSLPAGANFLLNKQSLTALYLDGNALTTLGPDVFSDLGNLELLDLGSNQIISLDDQVFAGLSSLKDLYLGHQTLPSGQSLSLPESLTSLSKLERLELSKTPVDPDKLWLRIGPMDSLKFLFLDGTALTSVPEYAFRDLSQLEELSLDNNLLTEVTQEMLAGPRGLKKLSLNRNRITKVHRCVFYGFTLSPPLSLALANNPLHCDCTLRWLLEERDAGRITLTQAETCGSPAAQAGSYLLDKAPEEFTCVSPPPEEVCLDPYTTPGPPASTDAPTNLITSLMVTNISNTSVTLNWTVSDSPTLSNVKVLYMNLENSESTLSPAIDADKTVYKVTGLKPNTQYSVCLLAFFSSSGTAQQTLCRTAKTLSSGSSEEKTDDGDNSKEIGIIVGTIVAVLVLLAIIAAIVCLVCCRKRRSKDMPPQPHVFTPTELPTMTANSRQFGKPPEKSPPKVGRALDENMKVAVISDGHTAPVSPRHSAGSYQFLDENHPNPHPGGKPNNFGTYSNDVDSRPLPTAPNRSLTGYYNGGSSSAYNEIEDK